MMTNLVITQPYLIVIHPKAKFDIHQIKRWSSPLWDSRGVYSPNITIRLYAHLFLIICFFPPSYNQIMINTRVNFCFPIKLCLLLSFFQISSKECSKKQNMRIKLFWHYIVFYWWKCLFNSEENKYFHNISLNTSDYTPESVIMPYYHFVTFKFNKKNCNEKVRHLIIFFFLTLSIIFMPSFQEINYTFISGNKTHK